MRVTFLRHGETTANAAGLIQGQGSSPLTSTGRRQAAEVGSRLQRWDLDLVVSSDLERAVDTAAAVTDHVETDPAWREADIGAWEGLHRSELAERFGEQLAALRAGEVVKMGGGESLPELRERVVAALEDLAGRLDEGQHALVVAHGGTIRALVDWVWGARRRDRVMMIANTSLTTLAWTDGGWALERYNDVAHLRYPDGVHPAVKDGQRLVTLVRHGRTAANAGGLWQGQSDWGLDELGVEQAERLAAWYGRHDEVVSSPLGRALQTAECIAADPGRIAVHRGLAELGFGAWEGRTRDEVLSGWGDLYRRIYIEGEDLARGGDGETWSAMTERMTAAMDEVTADASDGRTVVVSHGAAIRGYLTRLVGLSHDHRNRLSTPANTSVTHLLFGDKGPVVADYNVAPHLEGR